MSNAAASPELKPRDSSKPAHEQGLFRKFEVRRTDGSSEPGGKHHGCEHFVLDVTHDANAAAALAAYADAVEATHPVLAADMRQRYGLPTRAQGMQASPATKPIAEMTLGEKQRTFSVMVARLILQAQAMGYQVTFGDAYRDPRVHGEQGVRKSYSAANSAHKNRLAVDLNLFRRGKYLAATEDHQPLGEWWEAQGGTWGGRWQDGNHYSLEHRGVK